ncbi:hypothetical protein J6590_050137 [Homalodisca vitripennis]|nr:hypothetical protein J6590_050137 [Homalodisca vitripennis]
MSSFQVTGPRRRARVIDGGSQGGEQTCEVFGTVERRDVKHPSASFTAIHPQPGLSAAFKPYLCVRSWRAITCERLDSCCQMFLPEPQLRPAPHYTASMQISPHALRPTGWLIARHIFPNPALPAA